MEPFKLFLQFFLQNLMSIWWTIDFCLLKEFVFQELLSAFRVVQYRWRSRKVVQMVLSNACIINITLCGHSGDIEKLMIDKSLVGRLSGETVSHGR